MEFLTKLFWFPLESLSFLFNIGLWVLLGYIIYQGIVQFKELSEKNGWM
jgi:hypothetical protein